MLTSTSKADHSLRTSYSNAFSTKLSLPKFIAVAKLLTDEQRRLVHDIGFHHLLDIKCDSVPRAISLWLAKQFDVKSRCIQLADGSKYSVTTQSIHEVLGIPTGGTAIVKKCDDSVKKLIADETRCKGKTPTINELRSLLTPDLVGDRFKRIFTLFAIASFLCPTSYDCISTDYYSAIECPEQISSYDWCSAMLEKLTNNIDSYQRSRTTTANTTLGGCILALVIIYFQLLDIPIQSNQEVIPRLKFWSTDMIKAFETLDAKDVDSCTFGRLPLKNNRETILLKSSITSADPTGSTKIPIKCVDGSCSFKADFASLFHEISNEITSVVELVLSRYCDRLHAAWHCPPDLSSEDPILGEHRVLATRISHRTIEHLLSSKSAKFKDTFVGKSDKVGLTNTVSELFDANLAKGDSTLTKEESIAPKVQGKSEDKMNTKVDNTVEERPVKLKDTFARKSEQF